MGLTAFIVSVTTAYAICPYPTPKVCAKYFESDTVFLGEILKKEYISDPHLDNDNDWIQYTIKVKEVYLGSARSIEKVITGNDSSRWYGDVSKTYVLFISEGKTSSTCGPLDESDNVEDIISQIHALKNASKVTIEGEVFSRSGNWGGKIGTPAPGMHIHVLGNREYETVTTQDGKFSFLLSPGTYTLSADEQIDPSDYSHRNMQKMELVPGQCAQFQLLTRP